MAKFNLANVKEEVTLELNEIAANLAKSNYEKAKALWNDAQNMKSRVEETKRNMAKYGYEGILGNLCSSQNIDKYLVLAFMATESNGNPNEAPSESGYWGCMQVSDGYLSGIGITTAEFKNGDAKFRAQKSIEAGIRAIKEKASCFPENIWLTMTAYNAGQGAFDSAWSGKDTSTMRWWSNIENVAAAGQSFYSKIPSKYNEIGTYAARVMLSYSLFYGMNIPIGELPTAVSLDSNKQSTLGANYPAPAAATAKHDRNVGHGNHSDQVWKSPEKLYCEPIYPDYVAINKGVPEYMISSLFADNNPNVTLGANLFYFLKNTDTMYADLTANIDAQRNAVFSLKAKQIEKTEKEPTVGKPVNNNDPFPVDAKIEEFELHNPRCKIEEIQTCPEAKNVTRECIQLSINTEKRLVRLENNLATVLRYLARYAARSMINCVYFGGHAITQKYKCIRCLKDDRLNDGQLMSFDQCLNCTRFEPLIGQTYDIEDDTGWNLAQILDDCQMSYTSMDEYCKFVQKTTHQTIPETVTLDKNNIKTRKVTDTGFDWTDGLKMAWNTVPVEDQKPHINKIQDINGTEAGTLESNPNTAVNMGTSFCGAGASGLMAVKEEMDQVIAGTIASSLN